MVQVRTWRTAPAARTRTTSRERRRSGTSLLVAAVVALMALGVMAGTVVASAVFAGSTASAGAAGILPPANPAANTPQSSPDWLAAIDNARALEGVGAMPINEAEFEQLPAAEQLFIALNFERIGPGSSADHVHDVAAERGRRAGCRRGRVIPRSRPS